MSKKIVEEALSKKEQKDLWAAGYRPALPITPGYFSLGSVLPAVLYMMRWGYRRGSGKFSAIYGKEATISKVAEGLSADTSCFDGFGDEVQQAILGDLLLAYCLENRRHETGRDKQVQRVFPTHYFSSWIDLPVTVAHLRGVPELIVAVLARQEDGDVVTNGRGSSHYTVRAGFDKNLLLKIFGIGTRIEGSPNDNLKTDRFSEQVPVGIDQLLAIRLAQSLGEPPTKVRGKKEEPPEITYQQPVAQLASDQFNEDFSVFLRAYGRHIPRQSLLSMIDSCFSIAMSNVFLSTLNLIFLWSRTGAIPQKQDQHPWPLFVDCSVSADMTLRRFSEECMDDIIRRLSRFSVCMMCLRILDGQAKQQRLKYPTASDSMTRINFLGDLLFGRLNESKEIEHDIRKTCNKLSDALEEEGETQAKQVLDNENVPAAWRLAEALVVMMGDKLQGAQFRQYMDSCLMLDQPNGIGRKRRVTLKGKATERRSIVLTNTALDFLVHRHLRKPNKHTGPTTLSLTGFIRILSDRYGFCIDEAPPGLSIPSDQLRKNRNYLERRLRDLGLLVGVNDAEAMKRLRQRFEVNDDNNQ
ncbi:MAG: hypothetical protein ACREA9_13155 [Pyrinomonadaceae bacterium]